MISAKGLLWQSPGTGELLLSTPADNPLVVQLFGSEPEIMAQAVLILRKAGYRLFDCNMGCPVRKVLRQNAGAALLNNAHAAVAVAEAMLRAARAAGTDLPSEPAQIGFKLRLPAQLNILWDLARRFEDLGAQWLTLHPRTAAQGYSGTANHEATRQLVQTVSIPVIASGDMLSARNACEILRQTGAATVMYARGALMNPYVFSDHVNEMQGLPLSAPAHRDLCRLIKRHITLTRHFAGERRAFIKMRSIIPRYVKGLRGVHELRLKLCACASWEELDQCLESFLEQGENHG